MTDVSGILEPGDDKQDDSFEGQLNGLEINGRTLGEGSIDTSKLYYPYALNQDPEGVAEAWGIIAAATEDLRILHTNLMDLYTLFRDGQIETILAGIKDNDIRIEATQLVNEFLKTNVRYMTIQHNLPMMTNKKGRVSEVVWGPIMLIQTVLHQQASEVMKVIGKYRFEEE